MVFELKSGTMKELLDIPDSHVAVLFIPIIRKKGASNPLTAEQIALAIDNPIGYQSIEELVGPDVKVAIVVDDATRPTPTRKILPHLLNRLKKANAS